MNGKSNNISNKLSAKLAIAVRVEVVNNLLQIAHKNRIKLIPVFGANLLLLKESIKEKLLIEFPIEFIVNEIDSDKLVSILISDEKCFLEKETVFKYCFTFKISGITVQFDIFINNSFTKNICIPISDIVDRSKFNKYEMIWNSAPVDLFLYVLCRIFHSDKLQQESELIDFIVALKSNYKKNNSKLLLISKSYKIKKIVEYIMTRDDWATKLLVEKGLIGKIIFKIKFSDYLSSYIFNHIQKNMIAVKNTLNKRIDTVIDTVFKCHNAKIEVEVVDQINKLILAIPSEYELNYCFDESYLIGTSSGLWLLMKNNLKRLTAGTTYGITKQNNNWFHCQYTGHYSNINSFKLIINGSNVNLINRNTKILGLHVGVHQIDSFNNNLYIVNTNRNILLICDKNGKIKKIFPNRKIKGHYKNNNHFNSVFVDRENIYILANNGPMRPKINSEIYIIEKDKYRTIDIIDTKGRFAHNIIKLDNKLMYCNSSEGELVFDDNVIFKSPDSFLRGIAVTEKNILVGGSQFAIRIKRSHTEGKLYHLKRSGVLQNVFELPQIGQIFEIRAINGDIGLSDG